VQSFSRIWRTRFGHLQCDRRKGQKGGGTSGTRWEEEGCLTTGFISSPNYSGYQAGGGEAGSAVGGLRRMKGFKMVDVEDMRQILAEKPR
jgi:hypothetical protein